jgi:hypothetical protein
MTRPLACAALLLALCAPAFAADAPTATPVRAVVSNPLPADLEFMDRPYSEAGLNLTFMVEGENLVGVKTDSLKVTAATDGDGNDVSQNRDGSPACKMGSWPKATKDGSRAFFDLAVDTGKKKKILGTTDGCSVSGTVVVLTSPGTLKISKDNLKVGSTFKEAGLDFTVETYAETRIKIIVKGPIRNISGDLSGRVGDKKIAINNWSGSGDERTYYLDKPAGPMTLEFAVWKDVKEVAVPFQYGKTAK